MNTARQPAYSGIRNDSGGSDEFPHPGASQATTVNSSESPSSCRPHSRWSTRPPWMRTSGGPTPWRSYAIVRPSTSTRSTLESSLFRWAPSAGGLRPVLLSEQDLPQTYVVGRHLHALVLADELESLLQGEHE